MKTENIDSSFSAIFLSFDCYLLLSINVEHGYEEYSLRSQSFSKTNSSSLYFLSLFPIFTLLDQSVSQSVSHQWFIMFIGYLRFEISFSLTTFELFYYFHVQNNPPNSLNKPINYNLLTSGSLININPRTKNIVDKIKRLPTLSKVT